MSGVTEAAAADSRYTGAVVSAGMYEVSVEPGILRRAGAIIAAAAPAHRYAVVSDSNVAPLYAEGVRAQLGRVTEAALSTMPAGEAHKTRETWSAITDELLQAGLGRDSAIVALGGGVVCDVAGFVAATFMRGIPVIHIPTTLLAMIDASIGGKTGVDTPHGKNLVGAFHQPSAVIIDAEVLGSLPVEELRCGLAEALKHGAIADAAYFDFIRREAGTLLAVDPAKRDVHSLNHVIEKSVRLKIGVVTADERERGARKALNFGHTIGHSIEMLSGYTMRHGEAVGVGMLLEATAAERAGLSEPGLAADIRDALDAAGLPTRRPAGPAASVVLESMRADKKSRGGAIEYAVPKRIGSMTAGNAGSGGEFTVRMPDAVVAEVLG